MLYFVFFSLWLLLVRFVLHNIFLMVVFRGLFLVWVLVFSLFGCCRINQLFSVVPILLVVPAKFLTNTNNALHYFLVGVLFNVLRILALGVVISYLYKGHTDQTNFGLHPQTPWFSLCGCGVIKLHTTLWALDLFAFLICIAFVLRFECGNRV